MTQLESEVAEMELEHGFLKPKHICPLHQAISPIRSQVFVGDMERKGADSEGQSVTEVTLKEDVSSCPGLGISPWLVKWL